MSDSTGDQAGATADAAAEEGAAVRAVRERFGDAVLEARVNRGQWRMTVTRESLLDVVAFVRSEPGLLFDFLVDVTGLDHYGEEPRFRAVYVLRSLLLREELVLKVEVPEEDIWAPSLTGAYRSANWLEREAYDMFGIEFRGHPDLRRIMMPEIFEDFPLRKDFPMEGRMSDREWSEWIIGRAQREEG